jgi:hypothetical protein
VSVELACHADNLGTLGGGLTQHFGIRPELGALREFAWQALVLAEDKIPSGRRINYSCLPGNGK